MKAFRMFVLACTVLCIAMLFVACGKKTTEPFVKKVQTPTISLDSGTYHNDQLLEISCATKGAAIYYTTDGTQPDTSSTLYTEPIYVDSSITIIARAFKENYNASDPAKSILRFVVAQPVFSYPGGFGDPPQSVSISCETEGAVIRYVLKRTFLIHDYSPLYEEPIQMEANSSIKAQAFREGWEDSKAAIISHIAPMEMVYVPGGSYLMGDTRGEGAEDELPIHEVSVDSFYMGKYLLKQIEYDIVTGKNPSQDYGVNDEFPVYYVNWWDAVRYCNLRSIVEGYTPAYTVDGSTNPDDWVALTNITCDWDADGYRLPTEAEWEYAARGRSNIPDYLYSGSDDIDEVALYWDSMSYQTRPVGGLEPNALGIYDMSGLLFEWCWDWYHEEYYSYSPSENPKGQADGTRRVRRGGSWSSTDPYCRVSARGRESPYSGINYTTGIRMVRSAR